MKNRNLVQDFLQERCPKKEPVDHKDRTNSSVWVPRLQFGTLVAIIGTFVAAAKYAPDENSVNVEHSKAVLTAKEDPDAKQFSPAETRIIILRANEDPLIPEVTKMRLMAVLHSLEQSDEIKNNGEALTIFHSLAPEHKAGLPAAHLQLGLALLNQVLATPDEQKTTIPLSTYASIEHHLRIGMGTTTEQRTVLKMKAATNDEQSKLEEIIEQCLFTLIEGNLKINDTEKVTEYIQKLVTQDPVEAIKVLTAFHTVNLRKYDQVIEEAAIKAIDLSLKQDRTNAKLVVTKAQILAALGKIGEANSLYDSEIISIKQDSHRAEEIKQSFVETVGAAYEEFLIANVSALHPVELIQAVEGSNSLEASQKVRILQAIAKVLPTELQPIMDIINDTHVLANVPKEREARLRALLEQDQNMGVSILLALRIHGLDTKAIAEVAMKNVEANLKKHPTDVTVYMYKCELLMVQGEWQAAHAWLETVLLHSTTKFKTKAEAEAFSTALQAYVQTFFKRLSTNAEPKEAATIIEHTKLVKSKEKEFLLVSQATAFGNSTEETMSRYRTIIEDENTPPHLKGAALNNVAFGILIRAMQEKDLSSSQRLTLLEQARIIADKAAVFLPGHLEVKDTIDQISTAITAIRTLQQKEAKNLKTAQ